MSRSNSKQNDNKTRDKTKYWKPYNTTISIVTQRFYLLQKRGRARNNPGKGNENGSVEKSHDLFKVAVEQALLIRVRCNN